MSIERQLQGLLAFKQYVMELYSEGLTVNNWHLNDEAEPLANFIDSALEREQEAQEATGKININFAAGHLNALRWEIAGQLIQEAKEADGTFIGAIQFLKDIDKACIAYDDENRFDRHHIAAESLRREAAAEIERQFMQEVDTHKSRKIWGQ